MGPGTAVRYAQCSVAVLGHDVGGGWKTFAVLGWVHWQNGKPGAIKGRVTGQSIAALRNERNLVNSL